MDCFRNLENLMADQGSKYDISLIREAYDFCVAAHGDQKRLSGEPFYMHPVSVACILIKLGMDTETVISRIINSGLVQSLIGFLAHFRSSGFVIRNDDPVCLSYSSTQDRFESGCIVERILIRHKLVPW